VPTTRPEPIRVLRVIARLNVGGPAIQATSLSVRLRERGFETLLAFGRLSRGEGDMSYLLDGHGVASVHLPTLGREVRPLDDLRAFAALLRLLRRFRPAIVHTHTAKAGALGRLAAAVYNRTAGRASPARVVHTYHGHVFDGYFSSRSTEVFLRLERRLARWTDALVTVSPAIARELVEEYRIAPAEKFTVVPLGFDLSAFERIEQRDRDQARRLLDIGAAVPIVSWVGRLTAIKEPGLFLEVARLTARRWPEACFLIVGDGDLRPGLEAAARDLIPAVRFMGWRRDLVTLYAASDVVVLTSRNEGTPVALIEAMASGVPSVATDVGGVRDVVTSDSVGLLAPSGDARALADHLSSLLDDPVARAATGARARRSVVARYGIERLLGDVERLYRQLRAGQPAGQTEASASPEIEDRDSGS
jgi:glycosyltransferase involved in cell wall biosynthesis